MILYTPIPEHLIFPEAEDTYTKMRVVNVKDGQLIVEQVSAYEYRVVRLLSTDPYAYMNDQYSPGNMITML